MAKKTQVFDPSKLIGGIVTIERIDGRPINGGVVAADETGIVLDQINHDDKTRHFILMPASTCLAYWQEVEYVPEAQE
jgi:hypothetical protein